MNCPQLPNVLIMRIIRESTQLKRKSYQGVVDHFKNGWTIDFEPVPERVACGVLSGWIFYDGYDIEDPESIYPQYFHVFENPPPDLMTIPREGVGGICCSVEDYSLERCFDVIDLDTFNGIPD
jgi:hypothetical protein